ncbi:MAG: single-stranded-DNA-specific exonuclease RecJ, partial [Planctomycetota bacterium]
MATMHWMIPPPSARRDEAARHWRVPPLVAQLLINRGFTLDQPGEAFLAPKLGDLYPPTALPGADRAAELIADAIDSGTKIVVYGDYDVDGTAGVAILWHVLQLAGADVSFYVPHRVDEGYGLNAAAAERFIHDRIGMVISVDCGITAVSEVDLLREAGVTVVITDHHTPHGATPRADAIVHPTVGGTYPNPDLCGAGVAFKLGWAIAQRLNGAGRVAPAFRTLLLELLPLAALGTIADVVLLRGENRIIAKHGLAALTRSSLPGLRALIDLAGLRGTKISGYDVGFKLAPRINAAGRMGHARLAVELLTRADETRAREIALYLDEHNRARKATERKIVGQAVEMVEQGDLASDARRALVLSSPDWHAGVIGIVAARIVDRYHRPAVLIAEKDGVGQGSARSIPCFDLAKALGSCRDHLISFGGHSMAAGLKVATNRIDDFRQAFVAVADNYLTGDDLVPKLRLDAEVRLGELSLPVVEQIAALGPFGVGNARPRLAT